MKGRKPLPANLKRLAGDGVRDSGGRLIPDEPQAEPGAPDAPEELTGDALLAWHSFTEDMAGMGIITHADRAGLILLSQAWAELQQAERHIAANGSIIKLPDGTVDRNPFVRIRNDERATILKLLAEFGLTPSSRSRIRIAPKEETEADEFAGL